MERFATTRVEPSMAYQERNAPIRVVPSATNRRAESPVAGSVEEFRRIYSTISSNFDESALFL